MRPLHEIDKDLEDLLSQVDEETGELLIDEEALNALVMEREAKLEGMALLIKNWTAEAAMVKAEEQTLAERRRRLEKHSERLKQYLQNALAGEKLETARVAITYRKSKAVEIDEAVFWENPAEMFIRYTEPEVNKKAVADALKDGAVIPGAALVEKINMTIK